MNITVIESVVICYSFYPSFIADLLIMVLGAFSGLIAAYFIYALSIHQIRKDRLKYFAALISKIIPSVQRQANYCNEYATTIADHPFENNNLKLEANSDTKRLADKLDQEGVYHAFLRKYKRTDKTYKVFQELYGYIDYIHYLTEDLIKTNERILMFTWERKKQYQLNYQKLREGIQSLGLIEEIRKEQTIIIQYANSLLEEFGGKQPDGENLIGSYNLVVKPFQTFIMEKGKPHVNITELLFLTQELSNQVTGIELSSKHNALDYRAYGQSLQATASKLIESSKQLRTDYDS